MKCRKCDNHLVITDHLVQGLCRQCALDARAQALGIEQDGQALRPAIVYAVAQRD